MYFSTKDDDCCTYSPGYWKSHSIYGSAKYDDTWNELEDTPFFNTGLTYYEIMHMPAHEGADVILARQYMAAQLNIANRADGPDIVNLSLTLGEDFFSGGSHTREIILTAADVLDDYNNGVIGPGACAEGEKIEKEEEE